MAAEQRARAGLPARVPERPAVVVLPPARARSLAIAEFQPDAVEIEERPPPRVARLAPYLVALLITAIVVWASVSWIDEVVVAPGKLVTTEPTILIQPLETSIVRSLDVAVGDIVAAGQMLARLDPTFSQSDTEELRARFAAMDAQARRLEAELDGSDWAALAGPSREERLQAQLFQQRRAFYATQVRNFEQQIAGADARLAGLASEEAVLVDRLDGLLQIQTIRETLLQNQTGSRLNYLVSRDTRLDVEAALSRVRGSRAETAHTIEKARADRQGFIESFRSAILEELAKVRVDREAALQQLKKSELRRGLVELTAPAAAVVLDRAQRSIGSVVRETEPLFTLVPLDVPVEAEISIRAQDVGNIATGQSARVKLDAFPFQKFGTATGQIRVVSHDSFTDTQAAGAGPGREGKAAPAHFKALVRLDEIDLHGLPETIRLTPGMTVSAEVKVGSRRVISYFLYPLLRGLDESIREP